jgi:hypothetical protein
MALLLPTGRPATAAVHRLKVHLISFEFLFHHWDDLPVRENRTRPIRPGPSNPPDLSSIYMIRGGIAQPSVKAFTPNSLLLCFFDPLRHQSRGVVTNLPFEIHRREAKDQSTKEKSEELKRTDLILG